MSGGAFRLQSLIERCPRTFDTIHSTSVEDLLNGCAVLEMGSLEPEQKSLVSALTLISILAYLKSTRQSDHRLRNIVLIDEAHALLDQGEGATQEEKALNSTMTQLIINVITEIISIDTAEGIGTGDTPDFSLGAAFDASDIQSEAEKAAEYARSYGFDKAADYIERHYNGDEFVPGNPIPITTRNMALDGLESENGVSFERRTAELADGLSVEGVFPEFDSKHHVELGSAANDMSLHQQFNACREDFQNHMYDSPEKLQGITFGAMERMDSPQGYTPEGFTWQHNPETGSFDLVSQDDHSVGHTGGNALWGN